jgi:hypothetical protein
MRGQVIEQRRGAGFHGADYQSIAVNHRFSCAKEAEQRSLSIFAPAAPAAENADMPLALRAHYSIAAAAPAPG